MRQPATCRRAAIVAVLLGSGSVAGDEIQETTVYAAASLRDALRAVAPACETAARTRLVFNFGASNDLARQIVAASRADVFFSADEAWMDHVAADGLVDTSSRSSLLGNRLVVVVPHDSDLPVASPTDLAAARVKHLALANPDAVPAGRYARAWLEEAGVWEGVRDRIAPFPDVRATLAAVEAGAVEAGIVYRTDAAIARRVRVAYEIPPAEGPRITYPVAALADRPGLDAARRVVACFSGPEARAVFERFGFAVLGRSP